MRMRIFFSFVLCYLITRNFADVCDPCFCIPSIQPEVMICERSTVYEFPRYLPLSVKNGLKEIYIRNTSIMCLPDIEHGEYNSLNILKERFNFLLQCTCVIKWKEFLKIDCFLDSTCTNTETTSFENTVMQSTTSFTQNSQSQIIDTSSQESNTQTESSTKTTIALNPTSSAKSTVNEVPPSAQWALTGQVLTAIIIIVVVITAVIKACHHLYLKASVNFFAPNDNNNIQSVDGYSWSGNCIENPSFEMCELSS